MPTLFERPGFPDINDLFEKIGDDGYNYYNYSLHLINEGKTIGEVAEELNIPQNVIFARAYRAGKFDNPKFMEVKKITRFNSIQMNCE